MSLRALVIEAQPDIRRLISLKLGRAGFRVIPALDADDGLEQALSEKPDVIVLDVSPPDAKGYAIAREIRRRLVDPPPVIVMLSVLDGVAGIAEAFASGADDYLVKPFAPRELVERVIVALARRGRAGDLAESLQNDRERRRSR